MAGKGKLVPKLRFPEFRETGEWAVAKGGEVFEQVSNRADKSDYLILAIPQEHGAVLRGKASYNVIVTKENAESYQVVEPGDSVARLRSGQGRIAHSGYLRPCGWACVVLRKKIEVSNDFFKHFFETHIFAQNMNRIIAGIRNGKMIGYRQFSELSIPMTSLEEQQKIAGCLSSIDDLIAAQSEKLAALKAHRKGLMQQLFPREGKTIPDLRFPEFREAGEWLLVKGHEVFQQVPNREHGLELHVLATDPEYDSAPRPNSFSTTVTETRAESCQVVESGNFTIRLRPDQSGMAHADYLRLCRPAHVVLRKKTEMNNDFFKHLLKTYICVHGINRTTEGIRGGKIASYQQFSTLLVPTTSLGEQQKIAECLSSIDDIIVTESQKLAALITLKIGLTQQLFPDLEY